MRGEKFLLSILFVLTVWGFSLPAQAKIFRNTYISFEIRDDWDCAAHSPGWICRSKKPQEAREAAIILTAKEVGPTDRWDLYMSHMSSSQTVKMKNGTVLTSRVIYPAQRNQYNNQPWLDALHQDNELKHYYTRYLATIKEQIAVLVTFNAHNRLYSKYSADFAKTVQSLRIIASKSLLSNPRPGGGESIGTLGNGSNPIETLGADDGLSGSSSGSRNEKILGFSILIAAILGYIGYRYYSSKRK